MAEYTSNYNLKKPAQADYYDVDDFNGNADILDSTLHNLQLGADAFSEDVQDVEARLSAVEKETNNHCTYISNLEQKMESAERKIETAEGNIENAEAKLKEINSGEGYIEIGDVIIQYGNVTKSATELKDGGAFNILLDKRIDMDKPYSVNFSSREPLTDSGNNIIAVTAMLNGGTMLTINKAMLSMRLSSEISSVTFYWSVIGTKAGE